MFFLLSTFWFIRTAKIVLFYFYLWQLKEYHILRFWDHFRTEKGKRLILNKIILIKLLILFPFLVILLSESEFLSFIILGIILFLYFIEVIFVFKNIFKQEFKIPVLTKKTIFLVPSGLLIEILIFFTILMGAKNVFFFAFWLLIIDILTPVISSLIVLLLQVPTSFIRNQFILEKARKKRMTMKNLTVIGITGSYGKTSTKEFLAVMLSERFKVLKTSGHQNSEVGISQCVIKNLKPEHEIFIVEMGAYQKRGIKLLTDIVKPKIGILTGINEQHLALFVSQGNIIRTKYELIESLPKNGLAIFNGDNNYCFELYKKTDLNKRIYRTKKTFLGIELRADVWAENIVITKQDISFQVHTRKEEICDFKVNVLGAQNIPNILGALVVAKNLGVGLKEISDACSKVKPEQGSMKIIKGREDPYILDSSYSANPNGVISDLNYLKTWSKKRAIIMPCLIELGQASKKVHRKIGKKIGETCDLAIITTKERFNEIKEGAISAGMPEKNILFIENSEQIVNQINVFSSPGDIVLLEGRVEKKVIKLLNR